MRNERVAIAQELSKSTAELASDLRAGCHAAEAGNGHFLKSVVEKNNQRNDQGMVDDSPRGLSQ